MSNNLQVVIGVCREDDPADVDEAYGAGTYARLFPPVCEHGKREDEPCEICDAS